jgi:hypothetical protein
VSGALGTRIISCIHDFVLLCPALTLIQAKGKHNQTLPNAYAFKLESVPMGGNQLGLGP